MVITNIINESNNEHFSSSCGFVHLFLYLQEINTAIPYFEDEETKMLSNPPKSHIGVWKSWNESCSNHRQVPE